MEQTFYVQIEAAIIQAAALFISKDNDRLNTGRVWLDNKGDVPVLVGTNGAVLMAKRLDNFKGLETLSKQTYEVINLDSINKVKAKERNQPYAIALRQSHFVDWRPIIPTERGYEHDSCGINLEWLVLVNKALKLMKEPTITVMHTTNESRPNMLLPVCGTLLFAIASVRVMPSDLIYTRPDWV